MTSGGYSGGQYTPLRPESVGRLHQVALDLLWEVGSQVNSKQAFDIFAAAGARVEPEKRLVHIPRGMVEDAIASAPSSVLLAGRDEKHDLLLEGSRVYLGIHYASDVIGGGATGISSLSKGSLTRLAAVCGVAKGISSERQCPALPPRRRSLIRSA